LAREWLAADARGDRRDRIVTIAFADPLAVPSAASKSASGVSEGHCAVGLLANETYLAARLE